MTMIIAAIVVAIAAIVVIYNGYQLARSYEPVIRAMLNERKR